MSSRSKRILFVENEPLKIRAIVRAVRAREYDATIIEDLDEAREALTRRWWHLAVVDIRLIDDNSAQDFSGLDLVTRETDPVIPKLILTAYPTVEAAVKALGAYPGELPTAVDFVSKLDPLTTIVDRILAAAELRAGINWDLEIAFDGPLTFLGMADWLCRNPPSGITPTQSVNDSADELADLWAKLFPKQKRIVVFPSPQGRGNALVGKVKPYASVNGSLVGETAVVVKSGWRHEIEQEEHNYKEFILPFTGPASTQERALAQTLHFAGIAYSLIGGQLEETERFADFYRAEEPDAVIKAIQHLFEQVCAPWYESMPMRESSVGLDEAYRRSMRLESKAKRVRLVARMSELAENAVSMGFAAKGSGSKVSFELADDLTLDFKTLETWIYRTPQMVAKSIRSQFPESPTHGDLHGSNILVDLDQRTWLIDFGRTGYGYRLRDFAELESVIALELRRHKSLGALLQFEESIFTQSRWEDGLVLSDDVEEKLDDRELYKAWRSIQELRRIAGHWEEDGGDLRRYYLALFFEAVLRLVTDGRDSAPQPPPMWRRAHALLRAALIIRTLSE